MNHLILTPSLYFNNALKKLLMKRKSLFIKSKMCSIEKTMHCVNADEKAQFYLNVETEIIFH